MQQKIMLLEDCPIVTKVVESNLVAGGYSFEAACSPLGVIDRIKRFMPHLLLVDIGLPGLRGDKIVSHVREVFGRGNPRIIVISAEDEAGLQKLVASGEADDCFSKRKSFAELMVKIHEQLNLSGLYT